MPDFLRATVGAIGLGAVTLASSTIAIAGSNEPGGDGCSAIPLQQSLFSSLTTALNAAAPDQAANGGLGNDMWGTIVDRFGIVCAVVHTGELGDQWLGSRVISAQKANTAVLFNLPTGAGGTVDALSTANLWASTQPGGSLWGLQFSNPVDPRVAYGDNARGPNGADSTDEPSYGARNDPLVGTFVGGVNVFGGGLGLYDAQGNLVGGVGVSGDTSCADHNVAWRTRNALGLDQLTTGGVSGLTAPPLQDNIIYDLDADGVSESGFGHPLCGFNEEDAVLPPTQ
jgi:uncharacterized protein GlcG (DUF336 family)